MDWTAHIDGYCERVGAAFWAEPVNALTNLAFILAGAATLRLALRTGRADAPVLLLSANAFVVGIGSFLFHSFATRWAAVADTAPILVFILGYFAVAMNRFAGFGWGKATLVTLAFLLGMVGLSWLFRLLLHDIVGGSQSYFPAFLALLGVGIWLDRTRAHPAGVWLARGALLFGVSLTFRTLDGPVCAAFPLGTHFLWHLLNGLLFWLLLRNLVLNGRAALPADAGGAIRTARAEGRADR